MIGETILRRLEQIGKLAEEDKAALLSLRGTTRKLKRGEDVLKEGEHPTEAVIVLSGLLLRYRFSPNGSRQIHSFYIPTDTPCLESMPMEVMDNSLAAAAPSHVGLVEHVELARVMDERPHLLTLIWRETLIQGALVREWLMRNSQMLAHAQMAHFFCEIMTRARAAGVADGDSCAFPITQEDLADALGMTTVHVNRTLQILRAGGLMEFRGGKLTVRDLPQLSEIAEFDPSYLHLKN
jgi:CRP-like cAMP-binding protein